MERTHLGCGDEVGVTTRDDALGKADVEDKWRSSDDARITAGANGATDGNFNIVTAIQSGIQRISLRRIFLRSTASLPVEGGGGRVVPLGGGGMGGGDARGCGVGMGGTLLPFGSIGCVRFLRLRAK